MKRSRFGQPEWASEEERRLGEEWLTSESELTITDYIWKHASKRLRKEYMRQEKVYQKMRFGREILPDGEIVIWN